MNRFVVRLGVLALPVLLATQIWAQQAPASRVEEAVHKEAVPASKPAAAHKAGHKAIAPATPLALFGVFPIATHSDEARKLLEKSINEYENVLLDNSVANAKQATVRDPHFALAYAVWGYAANRTQPAPEAIKHARALLPTATADEQLLVTWLLDVQEANNLAAISAMNDLRERFPADEHVLYLTAEWLYFQQDYARAKKMMERILDIDPNFPPALNMLGYSYVETGDPDPAKAVNYLKRYASLEENQPNPEDSLGEVLRYAGDDAGSIEHYSAALKITPNFYSSNLGVADTRTLMGDYAGARAQYDKVIAAATNPRDKLHAQFQKALVYFWEGQPEEGRKALLATLELARREKEPYGQFEVGLALAQLSENNASAMEQLKAVETSIEKPVTGMSEPDRNLSVGQVLREEARYASANGQLEVAQEAISKLERYAAITRDLIVENNYESARGFALFAQGDFANAVDELTTDPHSPIALQQLALGYDKLNAAAEAQTIRTRLKYQRAPTVEWYLVTHPAAAAKPSAATTASATE
ncbi:MAG TPA: tetratricopeptide repeat protein [Candidatus Sulfotelmatobacter sp.]|nr:tetratricopeptide repeat protein [Candidatus Sulfotelmatobacter sp.]